MKVQLPWAGKATGSSAGLIYQSYWGKTYARTFPAIFHYPNTPAQQRCQDEYFDMRHEIDACYEEIRYDISPYQKRIRNPYNVIFQSARKMFLANSLNPYSMLQESFGVDAINAISANIFLGQSYIDSKKVVLDARLISYESKFNFFPTKCWFTLFNRYRSQLWTRQAEIQQDYLLAYHDNTTGWRSTDDVYFYVLIADEHYMSNFFLTTII